MCSFLDCERVTLIQLLDMHEALDLRRAMNERAIENAKRK